MPSIKKINKTNVFFSVGGIGIILGSIFFIHSHALQSEIQIRKTEIRKLRIDNRRLSGKLLPTLGMTHHRPSHLNPVTTNYVLVMSSLRKTAVTHHIVLSQVTLENAVEGVSAASNLGLNLRAAKSASRHYPGLQVIKVRVTGEWQDYPSLKAWLMAFRHLPISIIHLDISSNNFDMELVIYGA